MTNYSALARLQSISLFIAKLVFPSIAPLRNDSFRAIEISIFESKLSIFKILAQTQLQVGPFREHFEPLFAATRLNQDQLFSVSHNGNSLTAGTEYSLTFLLPFADHASNSFCRSGSVSSTDPLTDSLLSRSVLVFKFPSNLNNIAFDSSLDFVATLNGLAVKCLVLERINWLVLRLPSDVPLLSLGNVGQQLLRVHLAGLKMVEFGMESVIGDQFLSGSSQSSPRFFL